MHIGSQYLFVRSFKIPLQKVVIITQESDLTWNSQTAIICRPSGVEIFDGVRSVLHRLTKQKVGANCQASSPLASLAMDSNCVVRITGQVKHSVKCELENHRQWAWIVVHHGKVRQF